MSSRSPRSRATTRASSDIDPMWVRNDPAGNSRTTWPVRASSRYGLSAPLSAAPPYRSVLPSGERASAWWLRPGPRGNSHPPSGWPEGSLNHRNRPDDSASSSRDESAVKNASPPFQSVESSTFSGVELASRTRNCPAASPYRPTAM